MSNLRFFNYIFFSLLSFVHFEQSWASVGFSQIDHDHCLDQDMKELHAMVRSNGLLDNLYSLKRFLSDKNTTRKHYFSTYDIVKNHLLSKVDLFFKCSPVAFRVYFYQDGPSQVVREEILTSSGRTLSPSHQRYDQLLSAFSGDLVDFFLPEGVNISDFKDQALVLKKQLGHLILSVSLGPNHKFSVKTRFGSHVSFGERISTLKVNKLLKMSSYFTKKSKIPSDINLEQDKKVVVMFGAE